MTATRTNTYSKWQTTLDDTLMTIETTVQFYGETVYVTVELPDGTEVERRGKMKVERGLRFDGGRVLHPIVDVMVNSVLGDVSVHDRAMIGAAEKYGSEVAKLAVDQWRKSPSGAHHRGEHDYNESQFSDTCPVCKDAVGQEV